MAKITCEDEKWDEINEILQYDARAGAFSYFEPLPIVL
jgi:hypothetical protein